VRAPKGSSTSARTFYLPTSPATTLTTRANAVTNRHAWNPRMTRPTRSIATLGSYGSLPDKGGTAAGRSSGLDTGIAAADAAAAVPVRAQPLTTPAESRETLAAGWGLGDPERGVLHCLRCLHLLHDRDAADGFATSCTDGFTDQFFSEVLQRSSHGCGAASAMLRVAAPAAKGATWMD